jgi:hypothetical protein
MNHCWRFSVEKDDDFSLNCSGSKAKGQKVLVIEIEGYVYMVPYAETDEVIFLEIIFPSRKYTRIYPGRVKK